MAITVTPVFARRPQSARDFPIAGTGVGNRDPLDLQLPQRHLELLHDPGTLVGPADDRSELAGLVVVELDHSRRLVVVLAPEVVDLPLAVVVHDHGQPAALGGAQRVLDADARQPGLS